MTCFVILISVRCDIDDPLVGREKVLDPGLIGDFTHHTDVCGSQEPCV